MKKRTIVLGGIALLASFSPVTCMPPRRQMQIDQQRLEQALKYKDTLECYEFCQHQLGPGYIPRIINDKADCPECTTIFEGCGCYKDPKSN